MPQVFQVLKCYKCLVFQIHQTKKSNKFECKMCGEKQSIKRHYGIGTGKDCRMHVQKLNVLRGNMEIKLPIESNSDNEYEDCKSDEKILGSIKNSVADHVKQSKWSAFIDKEKKMKITEELMLVRDREVLLEIPQKVNTQKFNVKAKAHISEEYLYSTNNIPKVESKSNLNLYNDDYIENLESEKISQDNNLKNIDLSTLCNVQLTHNNDDNIIMDKVSEKSLASQINNKNSRWAQYVDTEDLHSDLSSIDDSKEYVSNSNNLFSLCDDGDLDQVLNI